MLGDFILKLSMLTAIMKLLIFTQVLIGQLWCASGANILMASPGSVPYIPSHVRFQAVLTRELVRRGHRVVVLSNSILKTRGYPEDTYSDLIAFKLPLDEKEFLKRSERLYNIVTNPDMSYNDVFEFSGTTVANCKYLWRDNETLERLKKEQFDLILVNPFGQCEFLLHCYLDVPFVVITPAMRFPTFNEDIFHFPSPASYVPGMMTGLSDDMSFLERTQNFLMRTIGTLMASRFMIEPYEKIKRETGLCPEIALLDLIRKAELWLTNADIAGDFPHPVTPNFVPIGGLMAEPASPLPKELEEFVNGAGEHGVVVVSMGSSVNIGEADALAFANALGRLPQRIVWRHNGNLSDVKSNIKIVSWMPQNDLLGYHNTKLFIGHAGLNGIYESLYHAVPMVLIPYGLDQPDNAIRMCSKGVATCLNRLELNEISLYKAIIDVLSKSSYKNAAQNWSAIHKDQPIPPRERAVFWIEHIIKHGGAHLRPRGSDMNFIQYYMVDVMVFLLGLVLLFIAASLICCRKCYKAFVLMKQKQA